MKSRNQDKPSLPTLQRKILKALADDHTMKDAASRLGISYNTVHAQLRSIYKQLGVRGSNAAIAKSMRAGLI